MPYTHVEGTFGMTKLSHMYDKIGLFYDKTGLENDRFESPKRSKTPLFPFF